MAKLTAEKNELFMKLQSEQGGLSEAEDKINKLTGQKNDLEKQLAVRSPITTCRSLVHLILKDGA